MNKCICKLYLYIILLTPTLANNQLLIKDKPSIHIIYDYKEYKKTIMNKYDIKELCDFINFIIPKYQLNEIRFEYLERGKFNRDKEYCIKKKHNKDFYDFEK